MVNKTFYVVISLFLFFGSIGCSSNNKKDINLDASQVSVDDKSTREITDNSLHQAALNGNKSEVIRLLAEGTDVNRKDMDGRTSLMYASYNGHTENVNELLKNGAEVNIVDDFGRTALMFASSGPFHETVKLLLENQADPDLADTEEHFTALMYAAAEGQLEVVKTLLAYDANPALKDIDNDDAATFAENNQHYEIADLIRSSIK